ncbi:thiamine pyrophosphate-dependent dehydrogenase E1 component subunit alpha [Micromonospora sp. DT227]|uniref:thiamine pyrophosphate-dependent dehydrogenase E1 component subunit alpha n=1 Tax=Micromonospora sp. DT227 TaxID=3393433 RepID=UPI003CFB11B2
MSGRPTSVASRTPAGDTTLSRLPDEDLRRMLFIRHFEQRLLDLFAEGVLSGTTHTCLGQEYVPVALRPLLAADDFVFSNHRGHGHYLARFDDPVGLLAEVMGRRGAICSGVGGSQHILRERYLSTGVQGQSVPVAVGAALHLRRTGASALACVYVGDGTWGEGAVYEALNLAQLWRVPLLVVVEHNGVAQSTPTELQMAGTIADRAAAFGLRHTGVTSLDVTTIRRQLAPVVAAVRRENRPTVVEFRTYRLGPHSKGDDTRDPADRARVAEHDWYRLYERQHPEHFRRFDQPQRTAVDEVVDEVRRRPPATWEA